MTEHQTQAALFAFIRYNAGLHPVLENVYAIPNWRPKERERIYLFDEGMTAGVLDVFCSVARQGYHGFYIEFKFGRNKMTLEQRAFAWRVMVEGYRVDVYCDWLSAARALFGYLGLTFPEVI